MTEFHLSFLIYLIFVSISISGVIISGQILSKKKKLERTFLIPEPKILHIIAIWLILYFVALGTEWLGYIIGFWTWTNYVYIFFHAAIWWATILTMSLFFLSSMNPFYRYLLFLGWVLLFEYLQEAFVHFVSHAPLFGTPYLMITLVMCAVSLISFKLLNIILGLKLLVKKKERKGQFNRG